MQTRIIEIRAAEGGQDSKIFTKQLADAYTRMIAVQSWNMDCL